MRLRPHLGGKDWSLENRQIPWTPLRRFLARHAKATDSYVRETFYRVKFHHIASHCNVWTLVSFLD